jgi:cytochrome c553
MNVLRITAVLATGTALALVLAVGRAGNNPGAIETDEVNACIACHRGKRSFEGRDSEELAGQIREILDDEIPHSPLELTDTSDEAIAELAEALTAKP